MCIRDSYIDNAAQGTAVGGAVVVRLNLELLDVINDGRDGIVPYKSVIRETIEENHVAAIALPIH